MAEAPAGSADDERLAALLAGLTDAARRGEPPDIDGAARANPDLASELRGLWAAGEMAELMAAQAQLRPTATFDRPHREAPGLPADVPRRVGDYEILGVLGRGGMGVVYRARQGRPGRVVALKMLLQGSTAGDEDLARFRHEAEAAAHLDHPNIVPVYEVGEHEGRPYFTMRYIEGQPLSKRLVEGPMPPREAAALLVPACRAIDEAHRRGVLHRDLKPANILIGDDGRPYVTDFGLAKRLSADLPSLTRSGAVVGTPSYMAPEQAAGRRGEVGPASDVYGLGAILYQQLTGRPPFQAPTALDVVLMVLDQDPPPPRLLNPRLDRDLEMIVLKCLQKPPELRYGSAGALADDLESYLEGRPISARSTRLLDVASRFLGETHHAAVLENWGLLWMWHSLMLLLLCIVTNAMSLNDVRNPYAYMTLWSVGLLTWAGFFWEIRRRSGPITFVERQIAHLWAGGVIGAILLYLIEMLMGMPPLSLSPILALSGGMSFLAKAGILSGKFYFQAAALFATALVMVVLPRYAITLFGLVTGAAFFVPGLVYYLRGRQRAEKKAPGTVFGLEPRNGP
ncbi:MAG: serine/threonine-protein kinase [Isosphaeraceae bacterium]